MHTAYEIPPSPQRPPTSKTMDGAPQCGIGPETHADTAATRIFEYRTPDPHSASGELDHTRYLLICRDDRCLAAAEAEARFFHAAWPTVDWRDATPVEIDAILGAA